MAAMSKTSPKTSPKTSKAKAAARQIAAAIAAEVFAPAGQADSTPTAQKSPAAPDSKTTAELVQAVRDYAITWYHDGGWDLVVESWSDAEIEAAIQGAKTDRGAIRKVWAEIKPLHAYRAEIQAA
jgi:hypothetical protein